MSTKTKHRPQADKVKSRATNRYRKAIASALDPRDRAVFLAQHTPGSRKPKS